MSSANSKQQRALVVGQFLAGFPGVAAADREVQMRAYLASLNDVPLPWISCGLSDLMNSDSVKMTPSVPEVRSAIAKAVQRIWYAERGIQGHPNATLQVERLLKMARELAPKGPDELRIEAKSRGKQEQIPAEAKGAGAGPRGEGRKQSMGELVGGINSDQHYTKVAQEIAERAVEVPKGLLGKCLSIHLGLERSGMRPVSGVFNRGDWARYDKAMREHSKTEGADESWWLGDLRGHDGECCDTCVAARKKGARDRWWRMIR